MKLSELDGRLLRWYAQASTERDVLNGKEYYVFRDAAGEILSWSPEPLSDLFAPVDTLAEAHGVCFLCPKAFVKNGGEAGTHSVYVWFVGSPVPAHIGLNSKGETVRWNASGTGLADLVLTPSIQEEDSGICGWHGHVGSSGVPPGEAA